jgi:HPt (histidine-containing phosphotransfer) domain-containing protein
MSGNLYGGEIELFANSAHAMKSILATIGATELSEIAFKLEMSAKNQDAEAYDLFPNFRDRLLALHKKLSAAFPEETTKEKTQGDENTLRENLEKAINAVDEYDDDEGMAIINMLMEFDFGDEVNALLEASAKALEEFNHEEAKELLQRIT